jgi:hypothetical protein
MSSLNRLMGLGELRELADTAAVRPGDHATQQGPAVLAFDLEPRGAAP